ncbi:CMRF35-like molecule 6 isoform X2 [Pimephales promelas]|uniref:CMRF35-like molecule 6 isoform X2 n=1 Tax=Pimephales promelas TaxID=90988 RepID=UPI001955F0D9|nr:CMRF35-like molecule 6 isoform X2 [Pimephales promelas]
MKFPLIVCVFLLTVSSSQSVDITVRGTERDRVSITCPYPEGYENSYKSFFRGLYGEHVLILKSDGKSSVSSDRFSLNNNPQTRSFTVSISDLKMDDAGPYICWSGWTHRLDVQLEVLREIKTPVKISTTSMSPYTNTEHTSTVTGVSPSATHQTETETRTTTENTVQLQQTNISSFVIIVTAEALVLLLIAVPLIIVAVRKKKKNKGLLSSSTVVFIPVIYDQIKDTGLFCNPEDRDTQTTVFYSGVS